MGAPAFPSVHRLFHFFQDLTFRVSASGKGHHNDHFTANKAGPRSTEVEDLSPSSFPIAAALQHFKLPQWHRQNLPRVTRPFHPPALYNPCSHSLRPIRESPTSTKSLPPPRALTLLSPSLATRCTLSHPRSPTSRPLTCEPAHRHCSQTMLPKRKVSLWAWSPLSPTLPSPPRPSPACALTSAHSRAFGAFLASTRRCANFSPLLLQTASSMALRGPKLSPWRRILSTKTVTISLARVF